MSRQSKKKATLEQISEIYLLIRQQKHLITRHNALCSSLLMSRGFPTIINTMFMDNPLFSINDIFRHLAAAHFNDNIGRSVDSTLQIMLLKNPDMLEALTPHHYKQLNELYQTIRQTDYSSAIQLNTQISPTIIEQTKQFMDGSLSAEVFSTLVLVIYTTLIHTFNGARFYFLAPHLFCLSIISYGVKIFAVDRFVNWLFPRGIIPLAPKYTTEPESLTQAEANETKQDLQLHVRNLLWFDRFIKIILTLYIVIYPMYDYATHQDQSLDTADPNIQELLFWNYLGNHLINPATLNLLMPVCHQLLHTIRQYWHTCRLQSTLASQLGRLKQLTACLKDRDFSWSTINDGTFDGSYFKLELNRKEIKFDQDSPPLNQKIFFQALHHVIGNKIAILSGTNTNIVFAANYSTTDQQLREIGTLLLCYLQRRVKLSEQFEKITKQYENFFQLMQVNYQQVWRTDNSGLPVISFLIAPGNTESIKRHLPSHSLQVDDIFLRVDVTNTLSEGDYDKIRQSILRKAVPLPRDRSPKDSRVVHAKQTSKQKSKSTKPCKQTTLTSKDPLEIKWPNGDIYSERNPGQSTVSMCFSRFVPTNCLFAKYDGKIPDPKEAEHFKEIIKHGNIVEPAGKQGIVYLPETYWMRNPVTNVRFEATYKVKSKHQLYGHHRLFGRRVETTTVNGQLCALISFSALAITHT